MQRPSMSMSLSLLRIPLVLTGAYGYHIAVTAPVPPAKQDELLEKISVTERLFRAMVHVDGIWTKVGSSQIVFQ